MDEFNPLSIQALDQSIADGKTPEEVTEVLDFTISLRVNMASWSTLGITSLPILVVDNIGINDISPHMNITIHVSGDGAFRVTSCQDDDTSAFEPLQTPVWPSHGTDHDIFIGLVISHTNNEVTLYSQSRDNDTLSVAKTTMAMASTRLFNANNDDVLVIPGAPDHANDLIGEFTIQDISFFSNSLSLNEIREAMPSGMNIPANNDEDSNHLILSH